MSQHLPPEVRVPIDRDNVSIFRDEETCIKCGQCRGRAVYTQGKDK